MVSILGRQQIINDNFDCVVEIFQADGVPESGHLRYSMFVSHNGGFQYLVNFDGYTAMRLETTVAEATINDIDDDRLLELEMDLIKAAMGNVGVDATAINEFLDCKRWELKQGSLTEQ